MLNRRCFSTLIAAFVLLAAQQAWAQSEISTTAQLKQAFATGGTYTVAAGNYWLDENIVIQNSLTLLGSGAEQTVLLITVGGTAISHSAGDLTIEGVTLNYVANTPGDILTTNGGTVELYGVVLSGARGGAQDSSDKPYGLGSAIVGQNNADIYLDNVTVRQNGLSAAELYGQAELRVFESTISDNNLGFYAEAQTYLFVADSLFQANMYGAYQNRDQADAFFVSNRFVANGIADQATGREYDAIHIGADSITTFTENRFENNPRFAISANGNAIVDTTDNLFTGNGGEYPELNTFASAVLMEGFSTISMQGDQFIDNPGGALELGDDAQAWLTNVHMESNGSWAYIYTEDNSLLWIEDSTFSSHIGSIFASGTGRFMLQGSHITSSLEEAIILSGDLEAWLDGSTITGNADIGVALYGGVLLSVVDTEFSYNRSGLVLYHESLAIVENSQFVNNERSGIAAFDVSILEAVGNSFSGNGFNGVLVDDEAYAVIEGNEFVGNPRVGVGFAGQSVGTVKANTISGSGAGIGVAAGADVEMLDNIFSGNNDDLVEGL